MMKFFSKKGNPSIHCAAKNNDGSLIRRLISNGGNVEELDANGMTPLHLASFSGSLESIKVLIEFDANIDSKNEIEYTPLMAASANFKEKAVKLLLNLNADPTLFDSDGRTPLICVFGAPCDENGCQYRCAKQLLKFGANVNHRSHSGLTALMGAAWFNSLESISLLLENGADKSILNHAGKTAKDLAIQKENYEVANLL